MKVAGLIKYLKTFNKAKVLVLGDVMMDHFIWGKVTRISPEAPVPVVNVTKETLLLGGAANVVNNITSLGERQRYAVLLAMMIWAEALSKR